MQIIPLIAQPNQIFNVSVGAANWRIAVYEKKSYDDDGVSSPRLYCDIYLSSSLLVAGALASTGVALLRHGYLTPNGTQDFMFIDTKGDLPPQASGLGDRWLMIAYDATDIV